MIVRSDTESRDGVLVRSTDYHDDLTVHHVTYAGDGAVLSDVVVGSWTPEPDPEPSQQTMIEIDAAADEAALDAYNAVINGGTLSMARIRDAIRASEEARIAYKRAALS